MKKNLICSEVYQHTMYIGSTRSYNEQSHFPRTLFITGIIAFKIEALLVNVRNWGPIKSFVAPGGVISAITGSEPCGRTP